MELIAAAAAAAAAAVVGAVVDVADVVDVDAAVGGAVEVGAPDAAGCAAVVAACAPYSGLPGFAARTG